MIDTGFAPIRPASLLLLASIVGTCLPADSAAAAYDWTLKKQAAFEAAPLAMAPSPDGRLLYLLLRGKVVLYSLGENRILESFPVAPGFDKMTVLKENYVVLADSTSNLVKLFQFEKSVRFALEGLPVRGPDNAPVTIAVFSDYQCPYCARLEPLLQQVLAQNPRDVKLVFKNYPLNFHKMARMAAKAALAAHEQGRFQDFHAKLFERGGMVTEATIQEIAVELKLDIDRFIRGRNDAALDRLIDRDMEEAREVGVNGTPSIFVNGKKVQDTSLEGFQRLINAELQR